MAYSLHRTRVMQHCRPNAVLFVCTLILTLGCMAPADSDDAPITPGVGGKADDGGRAVVTVIDEWNAPLSNADRDAKYCKLAASPFGFFRGTNHLFWADFAGDARLTEFGNAKTKTWLQGDLHAYNVGAFDNDRNDVVYSLNDFDESIVADYQYDVWRMATSMVLIARANGDLSKSKQQDAIDAFTEAYLDTIASYRGNNNELDTSFTEKNTGGLLEEFLDDVADDNSRKKALSKWTVLDGDIRSFDLSLAKLAQVTAEQDSQLRAGIVAYGSTLSGRLDASTSYFTVKSVARRLLAGTGSLGTPRFYVLIEGPSDSNNDDRILDVKRQAAPTAYYFLDSATRANYDADFSNHAQRHAIAVKALLDNVDDHLGWMTLADGDYSVRERSVYKEAFDTTDLTSRSKFVELAEYWGAILATTHSRADHDFSSAYVDYSIDKQVDIVTDHRHADFRKLVRQVAFSYADQVAADWASFVADLAITCD